MTLVVSLRVPDGIVVAGDSLFTLVGQPQELEVSCPECEHKQTVSRGETLETAFGFAEKVHPFLRAFGVATYGEAQLAGRTMGFALRELERELRNTRLKGVMDAAKRIGDRVSALLRTQFGEGLDRFPDDWKFRLGFHVSGYDGLEARTVAFIAGKKIDYQEQTGVGCVADGELKFAKAIAGSYVQHPEDGPLYQAFSLQDAVDYAEFLLEGTASYQRFSRRRIPTVGGAIDIGVVTPFDGFAWVRHKQVGSENAQG